MTPPGFWVAVCLRGNGGCGWHEHADTQVELEAKADKHQLWHAWKSGKVPLIEEDIPGSTKTKKRLAWDLERCVKEGAAPAVTMTTLPGPYTAPLDRPYGTTNLCVLCLKKDPQAGLEAFK